MPGRSLPPLSDCRDCQEPIRFVLMPTGRHMPVNPRPLDDPARPGLVVAALRGIALHGHVARADEPNDRAYPYVFRPHYATCAARKSTTAQPNPEPDPALF